MKLWIFLSVFFAATAANAQGVTSRVTGAVGGVTAGVGATAGAVTGAPDFSVLNTTPSAGGDWNGGTRARIGGKDITIRGAVASEGGNGAFKAGAGIGF